MHRQPITLFFSFMAAENSAEGLALMNSMAGEDVEKDHQQQKKTTYMSSKTTRSLDKEAKKHACALCFALRVT